MTQPRKKIISISDTPYYHCIGRCVRRAFLCGVDDFSGQSYEHRRQWIVDRINHLATTFAIDVCAYAVMSNHYHLVLRLSPEKSKHWSQSEVISRWQNLYSGGELVARHQSGEILSSVEKHTLETKTELWRERLSDLSWFMRCLNEHIAVLANKEDECTGRFWEGRFKSQALLDEAALITCMAYVDLNPIRSNMAKTPEVSDFTSIKERIREHLGKSNVAKELLSMDGDNAKSTGLPFLLRDYIEVVDWTGRALHTDKTGKISNNLPPILEKLEIKPHSWMAQQDHFGKRYFMAIGAKEAIKSMALRIGVKWMNGQGACSPYPTTT